MPRAASPWHRMRISKEVRDALKAFIAENKAELPHVKTLHFHVSRLERTYYTNLAQKLSLNDVLAKLNALATNQTRYADSVHI